jgi:hypothetical protein
MTSTALSVPSGPAAFVQLMKIYVVDYTNSHDQTQTARIMDPDYTLRMGSSVVTGRDTEYANATRRQMDQFPGLCLTVHEIYTSEDRLVMRFSEHGASIKHQGARAVWGGIGLYCWDGSRLKSNAVEQDYLSRAEQLASGDPRSLEAPAISPWDTSASQPDMHSEAVARNFIFGGKIAISPEVQCDAARAGAPMPVIVKQESVTVNDLFSCGTVVAFHISQHGALLEDFAERSADIGRKVTLHMAGILHIVNDRVCAGRIIRNRLELRRSLAV